MLILGEYVITFQSYFTIGIIVSILFSIYFLYLDLTNESNVVTVGTLIKDISEGLVLGLSWIIAVPITTITNIILSLLYVYYSWIEEEE